jgi:thymidylate kinase
VREGFLAVAREAPQRVRLVDGVRPIGDVSAEIFEATIGLIGNDVRIAPR